MRLGLETLESRILLDGTGLDFERIDRSAGLDLGTDQREVSSNWFASVQERRRDVGALVESASQSRFIGPTRGADAPMLSVQQWVVQLGEQAIASLESIELADRVLDSEYVNFDIVRGLGLPGMLLVESYSSSVGIAADVLSANGLLEFHSRNESVQGALTPDDPEFPNMVGLDNVGQFGVTDGADVNAPEAWDIVTGSPTVVVGVIDSGVDVSHPDLYLNIWINQGEIRGQQKMQLADIDGDQLYTFYDLNDAANADQVRDLNGNGYIDAIDLLEDPEWADGIDTDGNGFIDDFFGWNFRQSENEPFAPNNPSDAQGHGTHVAGTIGAIGNNNLGVTGLNWQSSIMALKFLDQNNQGDVADAIAAINYATMMRTTYGVNIPVTNNSWGQPGGVNVALRAAIEASGAAEMLFVAAAGNGNILGQGVDNDDTPFYPASFDLENIVAVAASDSRNSLARFSNFGLQSVDVAAPGVGIVSTLPGGRYGTANGTSMAAPHVAGTAALIHSRLPGVTVSEVKAAILRSATGQPIANNQVVSGGRINTSAALNDPGFAPRSQFVPSLFLEPTFESDRFEESEPNDSTIVPQDIDDGAWNINLDPDITDSTLTPHLTILADGNGTADFFRFTVSQAGSTGVFDVDRTELGDSFFDPTLDIYSINGEILSSGFDQDVQDPGSTSLEDPFVTFEFLEAGTYLVGVTSGGGFDGVPETASYELNISLENHSTDPNIVPIDVSTIFDGLSPDTLGTLQAVDSERWNLGARGEIEASTTLPHITIDGTGDGTVDLYQFTVDQAGARGVFDIDSTFGSFDGTIDIYDADGIIVTTSFDHFEVDAGSTDLIDPFLDHIFPEAGTFVIAITDGPVFGGLPDGALYQLHLSVEGHPIAADLLTDTISFESSDPFEITVRYSDLNGIDLNTIDNRDISITQDVTGESFFPADFDIDVVSDASGQIASVTYSMEPPSGVWQPVDFGRYTVRLNESAVKNVGGVAVDAGEIGSFQVRIEDESSFIVNTIDDTVDDDLLDSRPLDALGRTSLRSAIMQANQTAAEQFIFLDEGVYRLTRDEVFPEVEPNDSILQSQDLESLTWRLFEDETVTESRTIPHVSINGTGNGSEDVYRFDVTQANSRGIFDIDFGSFTNFLDAELTVFDAAGVVQASHFATAGNPDDLGSVSTSFDPFLDYTFPSPGTYYVRVQQRGGGPVQPSQAYRLHVSIENHAISPAEFTDEFSTGDLDVLGDITIVGAGPNTVIDAGGIDRVFDVHPEARLVIRNATVTGGYADVGAGIRLQGARFEQVEPSSVRETFEAEPNDTFFFPQVIDAEPWGLQFDDFVTESETIPHLTIFAEGDDTQDFFQFIVPEAGDRAILDIDQAFDGITLPFDPTVTIYDVNGFPLATSFDQLFLDPGSDLFTDSFLDFTFAEAGTYSVGISSGPDQDPVPVGAFYLLNVSLENHLGYRGPSSGEIERVQIRENRANRGAGLANDGVLFVDNSTIAKNTSIRAAGGIIDTPRALTDFRGTLFEGNVARGQFGSAIRVEGTMTLDSSTLTGHNESAGVTMIEVAGFLNVQRSTLSGNTDNQLIDLREDGTLLLSNASIVNNTSNDAVLIRGGFASIGESLIVGNNGADVTLDSAGQLFSSGHNVLSKVKDGAGTPVGTVAAIFQESGDRIRLEEPLFIGPLADNGGPTPTHELLAGSAAIDGGSVRGGSAAESEPNDTIDTAQSLEETDWIIFLEADPAVPFSDERPHFTVRATGDGSFDYFLIRNPQVGDAVFDIDVDRTEQQSFDSQLFLYDAGGNLVASNDDGIPDPGSTSPLDSYLEVPDLPPGDYIVGVASFPSTGEFGGISGTPPQLGASYELHVVLQSHSNVFALGRDQRGLLAPRDGDGDREAVSDVGAYERSLGVVSGIVYLDLDGDRARDPSENGLAGRTVFIDRNENGVLDQGEPSTETIRDDPMTADFVETGRYRFEGVEPGDVSIGQVVETQFVRTEMGMGGIERVSLQPDGSEALFGSFGASLSGDGRYVAFSSIGDAGLTTARYFVHDRQRDLTEELPLPFGEIGVSQQGFSGDGAPIISGEAPSISDDGFLVTYVAEPENSVADDFADVYIHDRRTGELYKVSESILGGEADGPSREPQISADGRFITFTSEASNLVADDFNGTSDVFVYEVSNANLTRVSRSLFGSDTDGPSYQPTISGDGGFVAFASQASNIVLGDDPATEDVFLVNLTNMENTLVTRGIDGQSSNCVLLSGTPTCNVAVPDISDNGQFVVFASHADNLVANDFDAQSDVFLFDRISGEIDFLDRTADGSQSFGISGDPSISADGRILAFHSTAPIISGIRGAFGVPIPYVVDRVAGTVELAGQSLANVLGNVTTGGPATTAVSADGTFIAFDTFSGNLVDRDLNGGKDVFVRSTPEHARRASAQLNLFAGEVVGDFNFGTAPIPGTISGQVFEDLSQVGATAFGPGIANVVVYLDLDGSRSVGPGEPTTTTDFLGNYEFAGVRSFQEYSVGAIVPTGFEQVIPTLSRGGVIELFLPAGGDVSDRNFGLARALTGGQSSDGSIAGTLFDDQNKDGVRQPGEPGKSGVTIYLDANDNGTREFDEPQTTTLVDDPNTPEDETGMYGFSQLGGRSFVIRALMDAATVQTAPLGSEFDVQEIEVRTEAGQFTNVQDVVLTDINGDTHADMIVALFDANQVSIRLNRGDGTFETEATNVSISPQGIGPISVAAADLNGVGSIDLIVANNLSSTATILLDYDAVAKSFGSMATVQVGETPLDIAVGDFDGITGLDFAVTNEGTDSITILTNDGAGVFTARQTLPSGGNKPTGIVAGQFNADGFVDLAVTNFGLNNSGNVAVFINQAGTNFVLDQTYAVGSGPVDLTVGRFNDDQQDDLAVANFLSNTASLLSGNASGVFQVEPGQLAVGQGPIQLDAADIEGDGDVDILVTNLLSQQVSILRRSPDRGPLAFEPAESFGVAEFAASERISFAVRDLNRDGTQDIVVANSFDDTVRILRNQLVDGAHRVAVTGTDAITGVDFATRPAVLAPSIDAISDPDPIDEDASTQTVNLSGIAKGRANGPALRFATSSSNVSLIPDAVVNHTDGEPTASLSYTAAANASGEAVVTVTVTDAGADQAFDSEDDAVAVRSFTVTVLATNDAPTFFFAEGFVSAVQDSGPQVVPGFVTGVTPGGALDESNQQLSEFVVTADPAFFSAGPAIDAQGELTFTPSPGVSGNVLVGVQLSDDGGVDNEGVDTKTASFTITIASDDPQSIVLNGSGNTFFLTQPNLDGVQLIDIRGTGDNTLMLDADRIRTVFVNGEILVVSDAGDAVVFDDGWAFTQAFANGDQLVRQFTQTDAILNLVGPSDFTNPIDIFDINASGRVSSVDAIQVINELGRREFSDTGATPSGATRAVDAINLDDFRFFDVSGDGRITALDAVRVINQLSRLASGGGGLGEAIGSAEAMDREDDRWVLSTEGEDAAVEQRSVKRGDASLATNESQPATTALLATRDEPDEPIAFELVDLAITTLSFD